MLMKPAAEAWDERHVSVSSEIRMRRFTQHVERSGLRFLWLPNRPHRERWDNRRERPFQAHRCGSFGCFRGAPERLGFTCLGWGACFRGSWASADGLHVYDAELVDGAVEPVGDQKGA